MQLLQLPLLLCAAPASFSPPPSSSSAACTAPLKDTDFNGHDGSHPCGAKAASAAACCAACAAAPGCKVWTYMPKAQNCCFKQSAAGRRSMDGYVSGCVEVDGKCPVPIPAHGSPPPPPPPPPPPAPARPPPPCKSDEDCSLNGVCEPGGVCKCDPGWTTLPDDDGPWCGFLDFLPSPTSVCGAACAFHGGAGGVDTKTTSWGGSVLRVGGKYWMFAAEMAQRCTLGAWTTNSQVVTAVSDTPTGPFVRQAIAIPPWSHNPAAIHTPDGKFVIFTLGPGKGKTHEKNCSGEGYEPSAEEMQETEVALGGRTPPPNRPPGPVNFTIHSADS
jgi:hypothetical protein